MGNELNRRSLLSGAATLAGTSAMGPLRSACTSGPKQATGANTETGLNAALPTYVASTFLKPNFPYVPGDPDAMTDPGFLTYPTNPIATVSGVPGGSDRDQHCPLRLVRLVRP